MRINSAIPRPRAQRRTPSIHLREQLMLLAEGRATLRNHEEKAWASITFAGARHRIELDFKGAGAVETGESFIAFLPEHEFVIPGHLVADAAVTAVDHRLAPQPQMVVTCELLLLLEG